MSLSRNAKWGLLALITVSALFFSPKWFSSLAVWVHFPALLLLLRSGGKRWWLAAYAALAGATTVAQLGVFPMPLAALLPFMAVVNLIGLVPLLIDCFTHHRLPAWAGTLVFPLAATLLDILAANSPQGTWGNNAYTQFNFLPLMQLAAVTGIYGINFLYYWFASSLVAAVTSGKLRRRMTPWAVTFGVVLLYGTGRLLAPGPQGAEVPLAAVQLDNTVIYETMYEVAFDSVITFPANMDQTDPIMADVSRAMMSFMAEPEATQYASVHLATEQFQEQLFMAAGRAAVGGAKIISMAEGIIPTTTDRAPGLRAAAARFADEHDVVFLYATAVFHPEKVGVEDVFIENKVITFGPDGEELNEYFKNIPVMGIEPSFPGNGVVPSVATPFGNISPLICYDADHPQLVAQTSANGTGLMVVPTGNWASIAPFHTYMAAVRCIENGVGMLKTTNQGLSALIDTKGRLVSSASLGKQETVLLGKLPLVPITTPYARTAPIFAALIQTGLLACFLGIGFGWARRRFTAATTGTTPERALSE